jgi:hypothetical protein
MAVYDRIQKTYIPPSLYGQKIIEKLTDVNHDFGAFYRVYYNQFINGLRMNGFAPPPDPDDFPLKNENTLLKQILPTYTDDMTAYVAHLMRNSGEEHVNLNYSLNPALNSYTVRLLHKDGNANVQAIESMLTTEDWLAFFGKGDLYVIIDAFNYSLIKALDSRKVLGGINTYMLIPRELVNDPASKSFDHPKNLRDPDTFKYLLDITPETIKYNHNSDNIVNDSKQTFFSKFNVSLGPFRSDLTLPLKRLPSVRVEITDDTGLTIETTDDPNNDNEIDACKRRIQQYAKKMQNTPLLHDKIASVFQGKNSGDSLQGSALDDIEREYKDINNVRYTLKNKKPFVLTHDRVLLHDLLINNRDVLYSCMGQEAGAHSKKYFLFFSCSGVEAPGAKNKRYIDQATALIDAPQNAESLNNAIDTINTWIVTYAKNEIQIYNAIPNDVKTLLITNVMIIKVIQCFFRRIFTVLQPFTEKIDINLVTRFSTVNKDVKDAEKIIQMYSSVNNIIKRYPTEVAITNTYKSYETSLYKNIPLMLREYDNRGRQSQVRNEAETKVLLAIQGHLKGGLSYLDYKQLYVLLNHLRGRVLNKNKIVLDTFLTLLAADLPGVDDRQSALELINLLPLESVSLISIASSDESITQKEEIIAIFSDAATAVKEVMVAGASDEARAVAISALTVADAAAEAADIPSGFSGFIKEVSKENKIDNPVDLITEVARSSPTLDITKDAIPRIAESIATLTDMPSIAATIISDAIINKRGVNLDLVSRAAASLETDRNFASIVLPSTKSSISNIANKIYSYRAWLSEQPVDAEQRGGGALPENVNELCAQFNVNNYLSTLSKFIRSDSEPNINSATILTIQKVIYALQGKIDGIGIERIIFNVMPNLDDTDVRFSEFSYFSKQVALHSLGLASGNIPVIHYHNHPSAIASAALTQLIITKYLEASNEEFIKLQEDDAAALMSKRRRANFIEKKKSRALSNARVAARYKVPEPNNAAGAASKHRGPKGSRVAKGPNFIGRRVTKVSVPAGGRRTRRLRHTHKKRRTMNR